MNKLAFLSNLKPASVFLWIAICFHVLFTVITPPLQAPDELNHFYKVIHISNGHFFPEKEDNRLGGYIPAYAKIFTIPYVFAATNIDYSLSGQDFVHGFEVSCKTNDAEEFRDFPNTALYSPVSYFPQVLGVWMFKMVSCTAGVQYYAGRLFVFLFWLFCIYRTITLMPMFNWLFTLIMLLPMNIYLASSFSADTVTNALSWLFVANIFHILFKKERMDKNDKLILSVLLMLLAFSKVVYIGLVVLVFLLPRKKFVSLRQCVLTFLLFFSVAFLSAMLWSEVVMHYYTPFVEYNPKHDWTYTLSDCANYDLQKAYILQHRFYFLKVIWHSLVNHPQTYLTTYIGAFGQSDIGLPWWLYVWAYALILYLALTEKNKTSFTFYHKIILFCAAVCSFVMLLLSQHLMWDCVGEGVVDLLQGRYLIPLFPLLFFLFDNRALKTQIHPLLMITPFLFLIYGFSAERICHRFYVKKLTEILQYSCNAETDDGNGNFMTSNPNVKIDGAWLKTGNEHRSGNCSMVLSSEYPYGFTYKFKGFNRGDLLEAEVWVKGDSANLIVAGNGKNCESFYMATGVKMTADKNGWSKIKTVITFSKRCDSVETGVYLWNAGKAPVYADDIKLSVRR